MEKFSNIKKYLASASVVLALVAVLVCFGAGGATGNGNVLYSVFELIFNDANTGSMIGFFALVAGIVVNAIAAIMFWMKKNSKAVSIVALIDGVCYFVSGVFFAMVETFSTKDIYVASVFASILALCSMALMIACGADLLMTKIEEDNTKKYKYNRH